MNLTAFKFEIDADGIAVATWDMADKSMNVIDENVMRDLHQIIEKVTSDAAIKGCIITSGKDSFAGGADLTMLEKQGKNFSQTYREKGEEAANKELFENASSLNRLYRKLETCGKPFAAAIHGICLGGAFELALSCHLRIASDDSSTRVGLPEIKVGLFPGAGGTQRVSRLMQTGDALQMLFKGDQIKAPQAKAMNLIHDIAPRNEMVARAKAAILEGKVSPKAPWDEEKFKAPSGRVYSPAGMNIWPPANAIYRRETHDNYPAAKAILKSVYEGLQLPMDLALRVEARYFTNILRSTEAQAMIRTLFISMGELNKGARRPPGVPKAQLKKIAVVGAGFMGAGIAYVSANAGLEVVLIDRDMEAAEKGKALSHKLMTDLINKGRAKSADRDALLSRIIPATDYGMLKDVDLVVEAVFEDPKVKEDVIKKVAASISPDCIFASNTSTLPISGLATHAAKPDQFVGIHFFSPVEKMLLVEVIKAKQTGDKAVAVAMDFIRAIKKTPIVVNDGRGFFANRSVLNYVYEGHKMLLEGIPPAMIENAAKMSGMPVGPLSLNDETAIDLGLKIIRATKAQLGEKAVDAEQEKLVVDMVEKHGRLGRKNGKGFYDYPEAKGPKKLWPGLAEFQKGKLDPDAIDVQELKHRLLVTQALEAARTVEDGIVVDPREADVGSIIGFGFAPYTGGVLSYIDFMGVKNFVALCEKLAGKHGPRFAPNALLKDMAAKDETFYGRFGAQKQAA